MNPYFRGRTNIDDAGLHDVRMELDFITRCECVWGGAADEAEPPACTPAAQDARVARPTLGARLGAFCRAALRPGHLAAMVQEAPVSSLLMEANAAASLQASAVRDDLVAPVPVLEQVITLQSAVGLADSRILAEELGQRAPLVGRLVVASQSINLGDERLDA